MDNPFWQEVIQNKYAIPSGHTVANLTSELFSYLGSTDPELRDEIAYIVYANWLKMGMYTQESIHEHIAVLTANLVSGIGERDTDSVFLRSFSVLFLAEIVHNDNKNPKLNAATIKKLVDKALWFLENEKDPRGYVPAKGWAHALAHTADLLAVLAKNQHTDADQHLGMLNGITAKLANADDWVYLHGEDDRLAAAALSIFQRGLVKVETIQAWLGSLTDNWKGAWTDEARTRAFFNLRNFTRSLSLQVTMEEEFPDKDRLEKAVLECIQNLRPY
ncbi:MAG: DUF2785 domain-containing protein [Anaerolineales bacterium]